MGLIIAIVAVILIILIWAIVSYNSLIKLRTSCEEAFSSMDVFLKKRYDLIPNVVETVKGYAKHESETLERVVNARNSAVSASSAEEQLKSDNVMQSALKSLFALAEAYPDLKANRNFIALQSQLGEIETEIERSRRFYNAVVKRYNVKIDMFPSNIIASMFRFAKKPFYEISDSAQRENVKVSF